jgi:hypothetical protein
MLAPSLEIRRMPNGTFSSEISESFAVSSITFILVHFCESHLLLCVPSHLNLFTRACVLSTQQRDSIEKRMNVHSQLLWRALASVLCLHPPKHRVSTQSYFKWLASLAYQHPVQMDFVISTAALKAKRAERSIPEVTELYQ